jgi:hypothetical protein
MALTLTMGRSTASFDTGDDVVVTVRTTDDEATLIRKLRRIIALSGDEVAAAEPASPGHVAAPGGNGWAAMAPPELPDRLRGEVELIEPEA